MTNVNGPQVDLQPYNKGQDTMPQVLAVRVPQNYSQVLQAPVPTHVQMDVDKEGSGTDQFPALPKPQLPRETMASMVTIPCGANWMPTRELRPTVGL